MITFWDIREFQFFWSGVPSVFSPRIWSLLAARWAAGREMPLGNVQPCSNVALHLHCIFCCGSVWAWSSWLLLGQDLRRKQKKTPQLKYQQCFLYSCTSKIVFSAVAVNGSLYGLCVLPASMCLSLQAHSVFEAELWNSIVCVELCQEKGTESEKTNHTNRIVKSDREKCNEYWCITRAKCEWKRGRLCFICCVPLFLCSVLELWASESLALALLLGGIRNFFVNFF